jgi:hypothetical protein
MKVIDVSVPLRLITVPGQVATITTTTTSSVEIVRNKLDRLETLKILTDRIMYEDAELLRRLAKL